MRRHSSLTTLLFVWLPIGIAIALLILGLFTALGNTNSTDQAPQETNEVLPAEVPSSPLDAKSFPDTDSTPEEIDIPATVANPESPAPPTTVTPEPISTPVAQEPSIDASSKTIDQESGTKTPASDPAFLLLRQQLSEILDEYPYNIAVSVTDLQSGQTIHIQGDDVRIPGCTINFFVLLSVIRDVDQGLYPLSEVDALIHETIRGSNATTARALVIRTGMGDIYRGVEKVNALIGELGLQKEEPKALFHHPPAYYWESLNGQFTDNVLTANQMNRILAKLYHGNLLSPEMTNYFLDKLTVVKLGLNYLIPAGVDHDIARVSHKNGFLYYPASGWVDNDIGIVIFEKNGVRYAYAISLYMEEVPTKYENVWAGQRISRQIWNYFDELYK
jgi:beta-lactamase class A